jgi:ubiquinone/menaquinone biosynthesis C-methylase UbiE
VSLPPGSVGFTDRLLSNQWTRGVKASERATAFGSVADEYERGRPIYPPAVTQWLLEGAPGRRVADVGCGTGKLTRSLVADGRVVTAIDPSSEMLAVLERELPGVRTLVGRGESLPLAPASTDAVIYSHSFHWVDERVEAIAEAARVLSDGGVFGVVWNLRDESVDWVAELSRLLGGYAREDSWPQGDFHEALIGNLGAAFSDIEAATFPHQQPLSQRDLIARVKSTVTFATADNQGRVELLASLEDLMTTHPQLRVAPTIQYPYVTAAYRAIRRSRRSLAPGRV